MNRLTEKINNESFVKRKNESRSVCYGCESISYCITKCNLYEAIEKLTEYEDLEKQGLLIKLPCKIGQDLYIVSNRVDGKGHVRRLTLTHNNLGNVLKRLDDDIFKTREEAEKALSEV